MAGKAKKVSPGTIAQNRKARHDYFIEQKVEAGVVLLGWEVKSLRAGRAQLTDTYVHFQNGEAWLLGCNIAPLETVSTHFVTEQNRARKLLMSRRELNKLIGAKDQKGYTVLCTALYWKGHLVKAEVALAKGKALHDKRDSERERDWARQKTRLARISAK